MIYHIKSENVLKWRLCLGFVIFNLLDILLTSIGLQEGCYEANIVVNLLKIDIKVFFLIKIIASVVVGFILVKLNKIKMLKVLTIAFMIICIWNIFMISIN